MHLSEKAALVTGALRGVGAATALQLAQVGCGVAINYNQSEMLEYGAGWKEFGNMDINPECSLSDWYIEPIHKNVKSEVLNAVQRIALEYNAIMQLVH